MFDAVLALSSSVLVDFPRRTPTTLALRYDEAKNRFVAAGGKEREDPSWGFRGNTQGSWTSFISTMAQLLSMRFLIGFALICAASPFPQGSDLTACGHGLALVPAPGLIAKGIIPSSGRASASCIRHRTTSSLRHFRESTTVVHMTPFRDGQGGSAGGGSGNAGGGGTGGSGFDKKAEEAVDNYGSENSEMSVELVAEEVVDGKVRRLSSLALALRSLVPHL